MVGCRSLKAKILVRFQVRQPIVKRLGRLNVVDSMITRTIRLGAIFLLLSLLAIPSPTLAEDAEMEIVFPVDGPSSFRNDFHEPRGATGEREHIGIDIFAEKMTPVVAAVDGTITSVATSKTPWGYSLTIKGKDGFRYRYFHLNNDTPGTDDGKGGRKNAYARDIRSGKKVKQGDHLGYVGDSGNAEETPSHLHFEILRRSSGKTALNPFNALVKAASESLNKAEIRIGSATPYSPDTALLGRGSTGKAVRELQVKLTRLNLFSEEITGYYGAVTEKAILRFQKAQGIEATGTVGPLTRAALSTAQ